MRTIIDDYLPNDKQYIFHKSTQTEVVYGGAKGGGKSCALIMDAYAYSLAFPNSDIYLFRESYPTLEANLIKEWKKRVPRELYRYYEAKHIAKMINGSKIYFRYLSNDSDAESYQGQEIDYIGVDELTKHSEKAIQTIMSCMRTIKENPVLFRGTCNPGGKGHAWVKSRYIEKTQKGLITYVDKVSGNKIAFIQALVYDNDILMKNDPQYVRRLENLPETQRKAFLEGNWDIYDGQYFPEWNYDLHTVAPFSIPSNWKRYSSMDYGLDAFAYLNIAVDERGEIYVYREIYESGLIVSDSVEKVKAIEYEDVVKRFAPPDLWNSQSINGKSIESIFFENGFRLNKANNNRVAGWLTLRECLKVRDVLDFEGNVIKKSKIHIFKNCVNLIRCLPKLQFDDSNVEDASTEPHEVTHLPDALRYFCVSYTLNAKPENTRKQLPEMYKDDDNNEEGDYFYG